MQIKAQTPFTLEPDPVTMALHDLYDKHEYQPILSGVQDYYIHRCPGCGDLTLIGRDGTRYGTLHDFFIQEYIDVRHAHYGIPIDQAKLEVAKLLQARAEVDAQA